LSSEKLSSSSSVIVATTTLATCFKGVIQHKLYSWFIESLDTNSKGKHNRTHTFGFAISVRSSSCWSIKSHKPKAASSFTISKLKSYSIRLCYCVQEFPVYKCTRNTAKYCQTLHSLVENYVECHFNVFEFSIYFILYN
jgi:hypothetical protein